MKNKNYVRPELLGFTNHVSNEYFEAYLMGIENIEGKPFYVLKMKDHPRIVKMATSALRKSKAAVESR